jgi:uncharacterized protein (DUF736 family)
MDKANKIGAAWVKTSKKGDKFFSGQVEIGGVKTQFVMFKNSYKEEGTKQPDWTIYKSEPMEGAKKEDIF